MILIMLGFALTLLGLPGLMRRIGVRIDPRVWTQMCAFALASGAVLFELGLLLVVIPTVLRIGGLSVAAHDCQTLLGTTMPGGKWSIDLAFLLTIAIPSLAIHAVVRARSITRSVLVETSIGLQPLRRGPFDLYILPSDIPVAASVPSHPGRLIVSQRVVNLLSGDQLEALCAHEEAHLQLRHHRYIQLTLALLDAFRFWPPTRISCRILRLAIERWADETAAGACPDQRSHLRSALLSVASVEVPDALAAFSAVDGLLERTNALETMPRNASRVRWCVLCAPGTALAAGSALTLVWGGQQALCVVAALHVAH